MLAMLLDKPEKIEKNPLHLVELDMPKIKSNEILVRSRFAVYAIRIYIRWKGSWNFPGCL